MTRTSSVTTVGLFARHLHSRSSSSIALMVLIAIAVGISTVLPRAVVILSDAELHHQVGALSPGVSDLYGTGTMGPLDTRDSPTARELFGQTDTVLSNLPRTVPAPLGDALGEVTWVTLLPPDSVNIDVPRVQVQPILRPAVDLHWRDRVTIIEGSVQDGGSGAGLIEIAISNDYAEQAGLLVGDVVLYFGAQLVVAAIYEVNDLDAPYWSHAPELSTPTVTTAPSSPTTVRGGAFIDPASAAHLPTPLERSELRAWYPVHTTGLSWTDVPEIDDQLRRQTSLGLYLPSGESLVFGSGLSATFDTIGSTLATTAALVAIAASAPLGALLAVIALGSYSVADRRRSVLVLAISRGASTRQVRASMAAEGFLISLPVSLVVLFVVAALLPIPVALDSLVLPAIIALAVPVLFLVLTPTHRTDTEDARRRARHGRWITEVAIVSIAGAAVFLLARRGLIASDGAGLDPLLVTTPLLLTLVACVLILRAFPVIVRLLRRAARTSRGPVALVGSTAANRVRASALSSVFALVSAVSATAFSLVLISTLAAGLGAAAHSRTQSDIRVAAVNLDVVESVREVPGVRAVAGTFTAYGVRLALGADTPGVTAVFADLRALHAVRPDIPYVSAGSVLVSPDIADRGQSTTTLNGFPLAIAGTVPHAALPGTTRSWALVDIADAPSILGNQPRIDELLVAVEPGVDTAATAETIRTVVVRAQSAKDRERVMVLDTETLVSDAAARPSVAGAGVGLVAAAALSLVLCALAVAMEALSGATRRARTRGVLGLLGMSPAQLRGVLAWEFVPIASVAVIGGTCFGVALAVLVTRLVDLRGLTEGTETVTATVPWVLVGGAVALIAVIVAVTAAVSSAGARRLDDASAVKMGLE